MNIWYIFSAISCWQVFCHSTTSSSNQPPSHLHYHRRCIAALGQHMYHETVSLSQMQDHAVLKDDEVSPLVPAARCQRRQRRRQPRRLRRAGLLSCRWSQPASCPPQALWLPSPGATAVEVQNNYNNSSNNRSNSQ